MPERPWFENLREFVGRWYERPLDADDGSSADEVRAVEAHLGRPLPGVLVDWYRLVGRRLRRAQDAPVLLDELLGVGSTVEAVPIWVENQGCWTIEAAIGSYDPPVTLTPRREAWAGGALSRVVLSMLMSDTLVGAWSCSGQGPLGQLKAEVTGGYLQDTSPDLDDRVRLTAPALGAPTNPFFDDPWRGRDDLVFRHSGDGWEWMACTETAFHDACAVLDIDPNLGPFEVILSLSGLDDREFRSVHAHDYGGHMKRIAALVGALGHVGQAFSSPQRGQIQFHVTTSDPQAVFGRIRNAFPSDLDSKLVIAFRPEAIARFRVLHPAALDRWNPPA